MSGRVAPGDYSPGAPTDPDGPNSGIRLLELCNRCTTKNAVNDAREGQAVVRGETGKACPRHPTTVRPSRQPLAPHAAYLVQKSGQRRSVARHPVVRVVPLELAPQYGTLLGQVPMPVVPAPVTDRTHRRVIAYVISRYTCTPQVAQSCSRQNSGPNFAPSPTVQNWQLSSFLQFS